MSLIKTASRLAQLMKWVLPIIIIIVAYFIVQIMIATKPSAHKNPSKINMPLVEVAMVDVKPLTMMLSSQGTVEPRQHINLVSEVSGAVIWVSPKLDNGGRVSKGTTLLRIDPIAYEVALAEAAASLAQAELILADEQAEYKRATAYGLKNSSASTSLRSRKLSSVEAEYKASKERLRQAKHQLSKTYITAPFNSLVSAKAVGLGQYVNQGGVLMNLSGTELAEIELPISSADLRYLSDDLPAPVTLKQGLAAKPQWQASLVRVQNSLDQETRVVKVVAQFHNPYDVAARPLSLGMFVEATIQGRQILGVRLPLLALHGNKVFVVVDGRLQARKVNVYRFESQHAVIDQGLSQGDVVVMTRLDLMVDGMAVKVRSNQSLMKSNSSVFEGEL